MTAPKPKPAPHQWDQAAEVVLALGAAWLAFRGREPGELAQRTMSVGTSVCRTLERLDDLGKETVRRVVGCKAPAPCDCLWCNNGDEKKGPPDANAT